MNSSRGAHEVTPVLDEIATDVFAYVQPDGGWCVNNAGLIRSTRHSVLVDTAATEYRSRRLAQTIRPLLSTPDPTYLVNTHFHGDHSFGNAVFADSTIIAHQNTREEAERAGLGMTTLWSDVDWGDIAVRLPDLTVDGSAVLYTGEVRVELIYPGPAHTTGDLLVWLPERKVLFGGDIVMAGVAPYCLMGSVEGTIRALELIARLEPTTIVPGHGPLSGPAVIADNIRYLRWVQQLATEATEAGATALDVARSHQSHEFNHLGESERLVSNLHRAILELDTSLPLGTPIDVLGSFQDMITAHGGTLPRSTA
ncbi:MBL fold metallo-hydrolase [Rhodococcus jostii]|uniref:MBL fold metallo-hydrolase n=1 Tax=Rhodococcus jostii TaxID=132919 RepID=A0ABU4CT92_RHOJO|nr:MBL fold metallo-hydrolase [Rhodococcus jostii]MDV6286796.1 MBL fold metallo-hydrolase [Rhodococcus jostii]